MNSDQDDTRRGSLDRRRFLQAGAVAAGAMTFSGPLAAQATARPSGRTLSNKVTVVLFQRGGADHLNLYAPTGDPRYATLRPTIGIRPPGASTGVVGLPMDTTFSMHPSMPGIHGAFTQPNSRTAVVHSIGNQLYVRSHFDGQDLYETALQGGSSPEGWINRHLQVTAGPNDPLVRALALRGSPPRSLYGLHPSYAVATTADLAFGGDPDSRAYLETLSRRTLTGGMNGAAQRAYSSNKDAFDLIDLFAGLDPANYVPANGAIYPAGKLGAALREVAEVIKADLGIEFFAVDQEGWDHHSNLVARIAVNAAELDQAVTAFLLDLGALTADVVLVTMSEFGREAGENGSGGTDHGVGGAMLIAGGPVHGGQVHGAWPGLAPTALVGGRFLAPANDFRDVLREILEVHMHGTDPNVVFPAHTYTPIGVL